ISDNTYTDTDSFTITVKPGDVNPTVALALGGGASAIKEDSVDNEVSIKASSGNATDELTTVVVTFPGSTGVDVGELDLGALTSDASVASAVAVLDNGNVVITVTLKPGVTSLDSSFKLDAPVGDSDVDLSGITV
ncbi:hypothetical protein WH96_20920, partial [Kiloniella spongiae]